MKRTKEQKGITLIALIITIVVLLILAAVAISSIQNDGILSYAQNAAKDYNQAVANEQGVLGKYEDFLVNITAIPVTPKVGQYVEYDVSYNDMYNSTSTATKTFGKTDGWRYLGTESGTGNHLLISTGVPMLLSYTPTANDASAQWWDTTQTNANAKMTEGLKKNLENIPYAKVSAGTTSTNNGNTMIGLFGDSNKTTVGDYFKVTGKAYSNNIHVRTLTLAELNRAVNSANAGVEGYIQREETSTSIEFRDIPEENTAYGLFDLLDIGLQYHGILVATPYVFLGVVDGDDVCIYFMDGEEVEAEFGGTNGLRPVIVLPSNIQFTDVDNNNVLEIK